MSTIYVKDPYREQTTLTIQEANLLLQNGKLSTEAMAWQPGLPEWVPIFAIAGIDPIIPPPFPGTLSPIPSNISVSQLPESTQSNKPHELMPDPIHQKSGMAIASFVFVLLGVLTIPLGVGLFLILTGIIVGYFASKNIKKDAEQYSGKGWLIAARTLVFLCFGVFLIVLLSCIVPVCAKVQGKSGQTKSENPSVLAATTTPEVLNAKGIFNSLAPRVVKLTSLNPLSQVIMTGSGVVFGPSLSQQRSSISEFTDNGTDIVTNYHVIEDASFIIVETKTGGTYAASILFFDRRHDLAVIRIPSSVTTTEIDFAPPPQVGDDAVAIGNPQGLDWTMSTGIISRNPDKENGTIQTTAAISHGSSGGGLFDKSGKLLGITFGYITESQNLNLAVWINDDTIRTIAAARKGSALLPSAILESDRVVGYYQYDPNYTPHPKQNEPIVKLVNKAGQSVLVAENIDDIKNWHEQSFQEINSAWEDTYRKTSPLFRDYIALAGKIENAKEAVRNSTGDVLLSADLTQNQKNIQILKLNETFLVTFKQLIQKRFEMFPDDPLACVDYIRTVEDPPTQEMLYKKACSRWSLDVYYPLVRKFVANGKSRIAYDILSAIREELLSPAVHFSSFSDTSSTKRYDAFCLAANADRIRAYTKFNMCIDGFNGEISGASELSIPY